MSLRKLWAATSPAPQTFAQYLSRLAADKPDFFDYYKEARFRYLELCAKGQTLAAILRPAMPSIQHLSVAAQSSMEERDVRALLEAVHASVVAKAVHEEIFVAGLARMLSTPGDAPAWKLAKEFPRLRQDLVRDLLEPMHWRITKELERITPLEDARLRQAARDEAVECGLDPEMAKTPQTSALVTQLERYLAKITARLERLKNDRTDGDANWFASLMQDVDPIVEHYQPNEDSTL